MSTCKVLHTILIYKMNFPLKNTSFGERKWEGPGMKEGCFCSGGKHAKKSLEANIAENGHCLLQPTLALKVSFWGK